MKKRNVINKLNRLILLSWILVPLNPLMIFANELPKEILRNFHSSTKGEEASYYLTGILESQFSTLAEESKLQWLEMNRIQINESQTEQINDSLAFVFITSLSDENGAIPASQQDYPMIYEFAKVDEQWKINNRMSGHIIIDLFRSDYEPSQFHAKNSFEFDGKKVEMLSAFGYYNNNKNDNATNVKVKFYPFKFQERDLEYFKYNTGVVVNESDTATTVASFIKNPIGELTLLLDEQKKLVSYCVNGYYFDEDFGSFNDCIQPNEFPDDNVVFSENNLILELKGEGKHLEDEKNMKWDVNINIPLLKEGLDD